jgi:hypothetical protein
MTNPSRPTVRHNLEKERFEIDLGDGSFAIAEYRLYPGKVAFTHTEVPPAHGGQGLATKLVIAALAYAREHGLEVIPICPFFAAYITKHPEEQDLLDTASRKRLGLD